MKKAARNLALAGTAMAFGNLVANVFGQYGNLNLAVPVFTIIVIGVAVYLMTFEERK